MGGEWNFWDLTVESLRWCGYWSMLQEGELKLVFITTWPKTAKEKLMIMYLVGCE